MNSKNSKCRKELLKNKMLLLAGCAVLSGFLQYALLYKEVNTYAGDFGWGCLLLRGWGRSTALAVIVCPVSVWTVWRR